MTSQHFAMTSKLLPHRIAFACAILPGFALLITFIMSASAEYIPWCVPMLEGCTSISRAARNGFSLYVFRVLIVPSAVLQFLFWIFVVDWSRSREDHVAATSTRIFVLGVLSVCFLIVYANFLGTDGTIYKFLRRLGIYVYFATTVTAHLLLTLNLYRLAEYIQLKNTRLAMFLVSFAMLALAISQAFIKLFVEEHDSIENIIEWNMAIVMHIPFLVFASYWYKSGYRLRVDEGAIARETK